MESSGNEAYVYIYIYIYIYVYISQWELYKVNLEGGSFTGNPEGFVKENSGNRHLSP